MKKPFPFKERALKSLIIFIMFLAVLGISMLTKLPEYFDSYVYYEDFELKARLSLIAYRIIMYFLFPIIISIIEKKKKNGKFVLILLENFNIEFFVYGLISFLYVLLGVDKILGVSIFNSSDAFMLITGFVFCIVLHKSIPPLIPSSKEGDNK